MTVFDGVPDPFPFDADLSDRPAHFVLRGDPAERYIVGFLTLFWLAFGSAVTAGAAMLLAASLGLQAYIVPIVAILLTVFLAALAWWLWPQLNAAFRTVSVTIDDVVAVRERDLVSDRSWSQPLAAFEGVAQINRGTRLIGNTKTPLLAIVLKHPDPARSIPLAIAKSGGVGRRTVAQKARQLGIAALEGIGDESGVSFSPDAVVVNRWQALKVRLLYWGFVAATLIFAGGTLYQHVYTTIDPVWPIAAMALAGVAVAMHFYVRRYVVGMKERDGEIAVCTASFLFRWHRFPRSRIRSLDYRAGRLVTPRHSVNAPWVTMRVDGYGAGFIIDMQSDFVNMQKLEMLGLRARG